MGGGAIARQREAWLNWTVRTVDDGLVVGTTQATVERGHDGMRAVVAWMIGSAHQRNGCGSEAARVMLDWLAAQGVVRVDARIHAEHAASAGVARIAGLTTTGETLDGEIVWRLRTQPAAGAG